MIIAYGIGPLVIGQLNDWLGAATTPLNMRYSMLLCPLACLVAAPLRFSSRLTQRTLRYAEVALPCC